jgi:hypothetical protein
LQYNFDGNEWYQKWEEKFDASRVGMIEHFQKLEAIIQQILAGKVSPLAFHIHKNLFSIRILSDYTGIPKRHIKKHLNPEKYNQLDDETLKKYATAFRMSIEEFKNYDKYDTKF